MRKEILLTAIAFLMIFSLFEISIRVYYQTSKNPNQALYLNNDAINLDQKYSRHHYLNYFPTPNYISADGLNQHNSLGYRGEEFPIKKPEGVYRIVALGGSTTYSGRVKSYKDSYPFLLEKILRKKYNFSHIQVINAGVGGYNSWESLINLEFRVLDLKPDLIIIYHSTNDIHARLVNPIFYLGDNSGRRKPWGDLKEPLFFKSSFFRLIFVKLTGKSLTPGLGKFVDASTSIAGIKEGGFNEILDGTPLETLEKNQPIYFERNLRNMIAIAKEHNISVLLASWAYSNHFEDYANTSHYKVGFKEQNKLIQKVTDDNNVYFYDFAKEMPRDKKYWADGSHVNELGAKLKAFLFAKYLYEFHVIKEGQNVKK